MAEAIRSGRPLSVVVLYASRDRRLFLELKAHLSTLLERGVLTVWHPGSVLPGSEVEPEIQGHLDNADVILLFVSAELLAESRKRIEQALERARDGKARVVPIRIRHVNLDASGLEGLKALPDRGPPVASRKDRNVAWSEVADLLRSMAPPISDSPKPHPKALLEHIERYDQALDPRLEEEGAAAGRLFQQGKYEDARVGYQKLADSAARLVTDDPQLPGNASKRRLATRSRLNVAACSLNLGEYEAARAQVPHIDPALLSPAGRLMLVEVLAHLGELDQAKALLAEQSGDGADPTDVTEVRQILEICEGRLPDGLSARAGIQERAAFLLLDHNDLAAAAERACFALGEAEKKNDLVAAHALLALAEALQRTIYEDPPAASFIPEDQRGHVLDIIQAELDRLRPIEIPPNLRTGLTQCELGLVRLVRDLDRYLRMQGPPFAEDQATHRDAAEDPATPGNIEEALQALPQDDHPWRNRWRRVEMLRKASVLDRALAESLDLVRTYPGRTLIEYESALILLGMGRPDEALPHAEAAFRTLPGIGQRRLLAEVLLELGRAQDVWDLLQPVAESERPRVIFALARAADVVAPSRAVALWQRYVALRPDDGHARVHLAWHLFTVHRKQEAADVAWKAFEEHGDRLDLNALYHCALLQHFADLSDTQRVERMRIVMRRIRDCFPADPEAELLRLEIRRAAGITEPAPDDRIDFNLLDQSPRVFRGEGFDQLREIFQEQDAIANAVATLARAGVLPIAAACAQNNLPLAQLIRRLLDRRRMATGLLCPPVGPLNEPPILDLEGQQLLVSYLELLLLDVLDLVEPLQRALGEKGRLALFRRELGRIAGDVARFREEDAPRRLRRQEDLLRRIRAMETVADVQEVQPPVLVRHLHEEGYLDQHEHKRLLERLGERDDVAPLLDPIPDRFLVSSSFLGTLFDAGALEGFLEAFQGRAVLGPDTFRFFELQRNDFAQKVEAGELAASVHRWVGEGAGTWVNVLPDPEPVNVPPPRFPQNDLTRSLLTEPLGDMLACRRTMTDHPDLWLLTADAYMTHAFGDPRLMTLFAWSDAGEIQRFGGWIRATVGRELYFPALVRLLVPDERTRDTKLALLAELGFGDALGAREILRIERRFRGLDKPEPARLLDHQEWLARTIHGGVGDVARLRLATAYASAIFQAWCGRADGSLASEELAGSAPDRSTQEQEALARTLLERQERIARDTSTNALDLCLHRLAVETGSRWQSSWRREGDDVIPLEDGPVKRMWVFLSDWAGADGSRAGAYGRAMREIWTALDRLLPNGPRAVEGETLLRTIPREESAQSPVSFMDPVKETLAILSPFWQEPLLANRGVTLKLKHGEHTISYAQLLAHAVTVVEGSTRDRVHADARALEYGVPVPGGALPLVVRAPVEAILLRARPDIRAAMAGHWKGRQGRLDGEAYALLDAIEKTPEDSDLLRRFGRRAATALWRLVRDDPAFLPLWPQSLAFTGTWESPSLDDLRSILSEPAGEDWLGASSVREVLRARIEGGAWSTRADRWQLAEMASEVPGQMPLLVIRNQLEDEQKYPERVNRALWQLDHPDETPSARLAWSVLFLRVAAACKPIVSRPEGSIHLGEILPERLERLLERVAAPPAPDTLAEHEPALVQVCAAVVQRLAYPVALPLRAGLWLTYRLFQWLCLQLEVIAPDARRDGMKRLAASAPRPLPQPADRLDPCGFGRDRFDHRLAAVVHALGVMEVIAGHAAANDAKASERPQSVSSRGLEEQLRGLADGPAASVHLPDSLDWEAPQNVPDLALLALLRLNLTLFAGLRAEARRRRFEALPLEPDPPEPKAADKVARDVAEAIVHASTLCASTLGPDERAVLMERLRAMKDGPTSRRWRWIAYTGLFAAGEVDLDPDVQSLSIDNIEDAMWPLFAGSYLDATAARDPARLAPVVGTLVAGVTARGADPVPIALALGHVCVHATPPAQDVAREALAALASHAPFCDDPRVAELIAFLDLPGTDHDT